MNKLILECPILYGRVRRQLENNSTPTVRRPSVARLSACNPAQWWQLLGDDNQRQLSLKDNHRHHHFFFITSKPTKHLFTLSTVRQGDFVFHVFDFKIFKSTNQHTTPKIQTEQQLQLVAGNGCALDKLLNDCC
ncbi:hypothetical protein T10_3652 [Trichinella papuae]|uniref:Uncharacterized protein n=1 Tax=Trichinella papuae TaxID=268474 RepID=A0A0V1MRV9_9BILA|nr:hypothetical protein T10_3652 [Trichinella papuae]